MKYKETNFYINGWIVFLLILVKITGYSSLSWLEIVLLIIGISWLEKKLGG